MGRSRSECTGFIVSGNDRPHPNLLPKGEGTAIACVSLRGCASGESSRRCLVVQGVKAHFCLGKSLPAKRGGEGEKSNVSPTKLSFTDQPHEQRQNQADDQASHDRKMKTEV